MTTQAELATSRKYGLGNLLSITSDFRNKRIKKSVNTFFFCLQHKTSSNHTNIPASKPQGS